MGTAQGLCEMLSSWQCYLQPGLISGGPIPDRFTVNCPIRRLHLCEKVAVVIGIRLDVSFFKHFVHFVFAFWNTNLTNLRNKTVRFGTLWSNRTLSFGCYW